MRTLMTLAAAAALLTMTACQPSVKEAMADYQASLEAENAKTIKAGEDFLAQKGKEPGVVTLPSGLMYKVISSPNPKAAQPTVNDTVTVNYEGKLVDGKVFDSSIRHGQAATFPLNRVVEAWQIGIPLMHKGDTMMLYVPSQLGYGAQATPDGAIPANSVLIFKVELLNIQSSVSDRQRPMIQPTSGIPRPIAVPRQGA